MPTTKTYTVYTFDELSAEGKQKAIDKNRLFNVEDNYWYEYLLEQFAEDMGKLGIEILTHSAKTYGGKEVYESNIYFSGFGSQGDGASFEADVQVAAWIKANKLASKYRQLYNLCKQEGYRVSIRKADNHYCHRYTMNIDNDQSDSVIEEAEAEWNKVADMILTDCRNHADKLYRQLYDEYYYQTSDECISDSLIANEYQFTEDGEID